MSAYERETNMEEMEYDEVLDEWFIESLKMYKDLYVYQLDRPPRVMDWTSGRTVCVAGSASSQNQILELSLPPKLFAEENKGLCAERDFKVVHGGFADGPVRRLRHVPGTRCVVTSGRSSDLQVWDLGGDAGDVIRRTGSLVSEPGSRIEARLSPQPQVLHGARSGGVRLTRLTSGRPVYELESGAADPLSCLQFVNDAIFLAGCCNGNIYLADTRTPAAPQRAPPPAFPGDPAPWWTAAAAGWRVVRLSASGQAVVSDLRRPGGAVSRAQLDGGTRPRGLDDVRVSWAPVLDGCVAVSGFSGAVQIYDTSCWGAEPRGAQPLFQHCGHAVSPHLGAGDPVFSTCHMWHPERRRTLLSAASDGSVHVWDWVDQSAGSEGN